MGVIRDKDVDGAENADGFSDEPSRSGGVGQIGFHVRQPGPQAAERFDHRLDAARLAAPWLHDVVG